MAMSAKAETEEEAKIEIVTGTATKNQERARTANHLAKIPRLAKCKITKKAPLNAKRVKQLATEWQAVKHRKSRIRRN